MTKNWLDCAVCGGPFSGTGGPLVCPKVDAAHKEAKIAWVRDQMKSPRELRTYINRWRRTRGSK